VYRFHVAVSRITALVTDETALTELNDTVDELFEGGDIEVIVESGVVMLLLQSLEQASDAYRTGAATTHFENMLHFFLAVTDCAKGSDLLAENNVVEMLMKALLHLPQNYHYCIASKILKVVHYIVIESPLGMRARLNAVTHLLAHMRDMELRTCAPTHFATYQGVIYHKALTKTLRALVSSNKTTETSCLPYSDVLTFAPLLRNVVRSYETFDTYSRDIKMIAYDALFFIFSCPGDDSADNARRRGDIADFAASDEFEPLTEITYADIVRLLVRALDLFDDTALALGFTDHRLAQMHTQIAPCQWE